MKLRKLSVIIATVFISVIALTASVWAAEIPKYGSSSSIDLSISGWAEANLNKYYVKDGALLKNAWLSLDGKTYHFDEDGRMAHGSDYTIADSNGDKLYKYRFNDGGSMYTGWYKDNQSRTFFYAQNGKMLINQWLKSNNKWYYFDANGMMCHGETIGIDNTKTGEKEYYCFNYDGSMKTGWYQEEYTDYYHYYGTDGKSLIGKHTIDNKTYYFNRYGELCTGEICYNGTDICYSNDDGLVVASAKMIQNGWIKLGNQYVYSQNGILLWHEWLQLGGKYFYFGWDHKMLADDTEYIRRPGEDTYYKYRFDKDGRMVTGWYYENGEYYGYDKDGKPYTGEQVINNKTYIFDKYYHLERDQDEVQDDILCVIDKNGVVTKHNASVKGWVKGVSDWYYSDGEKFLKGTVLSLGENKYSFYTDYTLAVDTTNVYAGNGKYVSVDKNGCFIKNAWTIDKWSPYEKYYSGVDGYYLVDQWKQIDGSWYYFDYKNDMVTGLFTINGVDQLFGEDGKWIGKYKFKDGWNLVDGNYYYYKDGEPLKGMQQIGNSTYYLYSDGEMLGYGVQSNDHDEYCLDKNGVLQKSAWFKYDGHWYRTNSEGKCLKGWQNIGEYWFYFQEDCTMLAGNLYEINDKKYCFDKDGRLITSNWCNWDSYTGRTDSNGVLLTGWQLIDKYYYFFDDKGQLEKHSHLEDDKISVAGENGAFLYYKNIKDASGWLKISDNYNYLGYQYIYIKNGSKLTGWHEIGGATYYFDGVGRMLQDAIKKDYFNGYSYYMNKDGSRSNATGFVDYDGDKIYLVNGVVQTGWQKINNKWYYFDKNHYNAYSNTLECIDGTYYSFGKDGVLDTSYSYKSGWQKSGDNWYYGKNGKFLEDEYCEISGKFYYFDEDGKMVRNQTDFDIIYGDDGTLLKNQWIKIDGCWYYSNVIGRMYKNETRIIGGKTYTFDDDGKMI